MVAATVIANGATTVNKVYPQSEQAEYQNLLALTAGGNLATTGLYKATIDPANSTDGTGETVQLTGCTGVILGRTAVIGIFNPLDLQDFTVTAYVQADGVIEVRIQNESGSTVNLASGTWYFLTATINPNL